MRRAAELGEGRYAGRLPDAAREDSRLAARLGELATRFEELSAGAGHKLTHVPFCAEGCEKNLGGATRALGGVQTELQEVS